MNMEPMLKRLAPGANAHAWRFDPAALDVTCDEVDAPKWHADYVPGAHTSPCSPRCANCKLSTATCGGAGPISRGSTGTSFGRPLLIGEGLLHTTQPFASPPGTACW